MRWRTRLAGLAASMAGFSQVSFNLVCLNGRGLPEDEQRPGRARRQ
jgi:hypothetical protein